MSGDADHITAAREDGKGALRAMRSAFKVKFANSTVMMVDWLTSWSK